MTEIRSISAVTFFTPDMARAVRFYLALGFPLAYGGETAGFSSFRVGSQHLNLAASPEPPARRGATRVIFYVDDVDALHAHVVGLGLRPEAPPRDATWNERYFHLTDPDGHELSFAQPLPERRAGPPP